MTRTACFAASRFSRLFFTASRFTLLDLGSFKRTREKDKGSEGLKEPNENGTWESACASTYKSLFFFVFTVSSQKKAFEWDRMDLLVSLAGDTLSLFPPSLSDDAYLTVAACSAVKTC